MARWSLGTVALLSLAPLLAAGCAGEPDDAGAPDAGPVGTPGPVVDETTGAIVGLVLDAELVVIASATVWIPQLEGFEATTGPDGRYVLSRIPAGTHYVRAEALGYQSQGRTIDVAAGEVSDVSWHLEEIPFDEAFSRIQEQRGTLGCGVGFRPAAAGTNAVSACGAAQLQQQGLDRFLIKWSLSGNFTRIAGAAMEMEWQTTQALGAGLELRWEGFGCNINTPAGADGRIATLVGRNPLGILYNDTAWADRIVLNAGNGCNLLKCTTQCQLQTRVFPAPETLGPTYPADVGIVLQQTFKQYFSEFYVEPPPADHSALPDA